MRIHHLTVGLTIGGAERALVDLAIAQQRAGHVVRVGAVRRGGPLSRALDDAGIPCLWPGAAPARVRGWRERPDIVHTHLFAADALGLAWARGRGAGAVTTWHSVVDGYQLSRGRERAARALYPLFDERVAVSRAVADSFSARFAVDATVVPNPVPPRSATDDEVRRARAALPAGRVVVALGRLIASKGFDLAAAALAQLPDDVHLAAVGEGPEREAMARAAGHQGRRLHFLGIRDDVPALLRAASAVVLPSTVEGFSVAAVEAMHAGCPVAATRAGGLAEVLAGCPLPAIEAPTPTAVAAAVLAALTPAARAAFQEWAPQAALRYAPETICRDLDEVYARARRRAERA